MSTGEPGKAATLQLALAALESSGGDRFNPVRFHYIQAMAGRSLAQAGAVADLVADKAMAALEDYRAELTGAQAAAAHLVEQVAAQQPALSAQAQALCDAGDIRALRLLARQRQSSPLAALIDRCNGGAGPGLDQPRSGPVGEQLRDQEADAVRSLAVRADTTVSRATGELRAAGFFRDARQQQQAEQLVTHAVTGAPDDSGPLNPQKLAVGSLAAMRELSPAYLGRFVTYVDTLFWLEKATDSTKSS